MNFPSWIAAPAMSRRTRSLALSIALLLGIATAFYTLAEGWTPLNALYFSVVTLTSIGYGNLAPTTPVSKLFTLGYIAATAGIWLLLIRWILEKRFISGKRRARLNAPWVAALAFVIIVLGVAFYTTFERWSLLDALYFCIVTLTTVGYGDLVPTRPLSTAFTILYALLGIGVITIVIQWLVRSIVCYLHLPPDSYFLDGKVSSTGGSEAEPPQRNNEAGESSDKADENTEGAQNTESAKSADSATAGQSSDALHFEPFVHVAALSSTAAIIGWGGFYFHCADGTDDWQLVHDHELKSFGLKRRQTIGRSSESYGHARVIISDERGQEVACIETSSRNYVVLTKLAPDTRYRYRIEIDGKPLIGDRLFDWRRAADGDGGRLVPALRRYPMRFRTFPEDETLAEVSFAAIGDFGVGINAPGPDGRHQADVARALGRAVECEDLRFVVTTGDNIYLDRTRKMGSGAEDDDWYFSFYQPYRYVISQIPVLPSVGNHDTGDTERSDDRGQLADNFYLPDWVGNPDFTDFGTHTPALSYGVHFGRGVRLISFDTTQDEEGGHKYVCAPAAQQALAKQIRQSPAGAWTIGFGHHPPFCAGPTYGNDDELIDGLLPLFGGVENAVILSGHEHNFQHSVADGIHCFITGAGGKLRETPPQELKDARTQAWAVAPHFLLLRARLPELQVEPLSSGDGKAMASVAVKTTRGEAAELPIRVVNTGAQAFSPLVKQTRRST